MPHKVFAYQQSRAVLMLKRLKRDRMNLTTQSLASKNNNILLVDDDQSLREVISIILTDEGYNVLQADNGQTALNLLTKMTANEYPSCMILDLMMPIMSGDEFLEVLQRNHAPDLGKIPVIICSAEGKHKSYQQIVAKLEKPINVELLCGAIKGCSELH